MANTPADASPSPPSIVFPRPSYGKPHSIDPNHPTNMFLQRLRTQTLTHASTVKDLFEALQQDSAGYRVWVKQKQNDLRMQIVNPNMMEERMGQAYDLMLELKWQEAVDEGKALAQSLQKFLEGAEAVLQDIKAAET